MNNLHIEDLLILAKQEYQKDFELRMSMKASSNSTFRLWLASLGNWMVARGQELQARYAESKKTNQPDAFKPKPKKTSHNMYYTI